MGQLLNQEIERIYNVANAYERRMNCVLFAAEMINQYPRLVNYWDSRIELILPKPLHDGASQPLRQVEAAATAAW